MVPNPLFITVKCVFSSPVQDFVQRLVGVFIALDPLHEVFHGLLRVAVGVVGAPQLHLLNRETAAAVSTTRAEVHLSFEIKS